MTKFHVILSIILLAIFGGIFLATQGESLKKSLSNPAPTISLDDQFRIRAPSPHKSMIDQQQQGQGTQQTQQGQQSQAQPTYGVEEAMQASYSAVIKTSKGNIKLSLFAKDAPNTVKNFIARAKGSYYKNLTFHRVEGWVIQGGDPKGDGTGGGLMQTEINAIPFVTGSLGVARGGDIRISNDSQFFITKNDAPHLIQQYTNFGEVIDGMDVVNKIQIGDKILGITIE